MNETNAKQPSSSSVQVHVGGCQCGAVRFEARLDLREGATRCNCSVCTKRGSIGVNVKPSAFRILSGKEWVGEYRVEGSLNARCFCTRCGVQLHGYGHVPEIGGDFVSVNIACLDDVDLAEVPVLHWDGRHDNWAAGPRSAPWPVRA